MKNLTFYFKESKHVAALAIPMITSQITRLLVGFVATLLVAKLGADYLAASALAYTYYLVIFLFCNGLFFSVSITIGKYFGQKDQQGMELTVVNAGWMAFIFSLVSMALLHLGGVIFLLCGQAPQIVKLAAQYDAALSWGMPAIYISITLLQFLLGISRPKVLNLFSLINLALSILFFEILIFGRFGFPKLGLAGVGYSISLAAWINLVIVIVYYRSNKYLRTFNIFNQLSKVEFWRIKQMFSIGWPIGVTVVLEMISGLVFVFFIGLLSVAALAAYQIVWQVYLVPLMIPIAISQATAVLTSQHIGRDELGRIKQSALTATALNLGLCFLFSLSFWLAPHAITDLFLNREPHLINHTAYYASTMLMVSGLFLLADATRFSMSGCLRGMRDVKKPMLISITSFWVIGIPIEAIVAFVFKAGVFALWWSSSIGVMLSATLLVRRFLQQTRNF